MSIEIGEVIAVQGLKITLKIFETSSKDTLFYNGKRFKGVSIHEYISIQRGFRDIICTVEGEYLDERKFEPDGDKINYIRKVEAKHLSGGLRRRLVIAMGLIGDPEILLMDEPLAALDPQTIQMLQGIIVTLQSELNLTIIITDHQARDLLAVCDKALILSNSKIVASGSPSQLINDENANKFYFGKNFKFN